MSSPGITGESSFEADVMKVAPGCELYGCDFSVNSFYSLCTLTERNGYEFIDVLKVDVEGGEFGSLEVFIDSFHGAPLPFGPLQLELHVRYNQWEHFSEPNLVYVNLVRGVRPELIEYSFINIRGNHELVSDRPLPRQQLIPPEHRSAAEQSFEEDLDLSHLADKVGAAGPFETFIDCSTVACVAHGQATARDGTLPLAAVGYLAFCHTVHGKVIPVNTYGLYAVTPQHLGDLINIVDDRSPYITVWAQMLFLLRSMSMRGGGNKHAWKTMHVTGHTEALQPLSAMIETLGEDASTNEVTTAWDPDLVQKCLTAFETNGDAAAESEDPKGAIIQYSLHCT
ncbi:hypothetical protein EV363DRAFT_1472187 [Boletus edulis]|nr:hypothetical protein EV363DRAFT_1472187 [Boletus edulis]